MYNENAPRAIAMGYHPIPTSKKVPVRWVKELGKLVPFTGWSVIPIPIQTPQPGADIGIRCGDRGLVALDYDDEDAALIISEVLEPSAVNKAGQRAWTAFYRADFQVPSENFFDGNGRFSRFSPPASRLSSHQASIRKLENHTDGLMDTVSTIPH
jgi:hypothetical protein